MPKQKQPLFKKPKKDLGVPNLAKEKSKLAHQLEMHKLSIERQTNPDAQLKSNTIGNKSLGSGSLKSFVKTVKQKQSDFSTKSDTIESSFNSDTLKKQSSKGLLFWLPSFFFLFFSCFYLAMQVNRKQFYSTLRKVVEASDIVLEVLDARDPAGTRCIPLERAAGAKGKQVVLVVNKIGMISPTFSLPSIIFPFSFNRSCSKRCCYWLG